MEKYFTFKIVSKDVELIEGIHFISYFKTQ